MNTAKKIYQSDAQGMIHFDLPIGKPDVAIEVIVVWQEMPSEPGENLGPKRGLERPLRAAEGGSARAPFAGQVRDARAASVRYLLDTHTCIGILNGTSQALLQRQRSTPISQVRLCSVVKAELLWGPRRAFDATA